MATIAEDTRFKTVRGNDGKNKLIACKLFSVNAFIDLFGESRENKFTVIHHNDNDGLLSAHLLYKYSNAKDLNKYFKCNYSDLLVSTDMVEPGDVVVCVDYRLSPQMISDMITMGVKSIILADHHKTTAEDIMDNLEFFKSKADEQKLCLLFDANMCGAKLVNSLISDNLYSIEKQNELDNRNNLVELVDVYDRNADPSFKQAWYFNNYTFKCGRTDVGSDMWDRFIEEDGFLDKALGFGKRLYDLNVQSNEVVYEAFSKEVMFNGLKCRALYGFGNGYVFNDHAMEYDATIIYHKIRDGRYKYSIFSDTGSDIEKIAKMYGGGGHASAAGFTIDTDLFK